MIDTKTILCKHSGYKYHSIWNPRWHDRRVLISANKIKEHNVIEFTKTGALEGLYYISGKKARQFKKESNGVIDCYSIPLDELSEFEFDERCVHLM